MRLIDADEFKEIILAYRDAGYGALRIEKISELIDGQFTAYDTDKVVEQLEEMREMVPVNRLLDDIVKDKPKELGQLMAYRKSIEIVKAGGIE